MSKVSASEIERYLNGLEFPVKKPEIIRIFHLNAGDEELAAALEKLPEKTYLTPVDISDEIGKVLPSNEQAG